jgi:uncharacterized protein involved in tolerance to divalent cations
LGEEGLYDKEGLIMKTNSELFKALEFLGVEIVNEGDFLEFVFNQNTIKEIKKDIIKFEKFDQPYAVSIETEEAKLYIKTPKQFKFIDCDLEFNHDSIFISHGDLDVLEYTSNNILELRKYKLPEIIYFKILGRVLNINIIISEDNIGIERKNDLFQFHIFLDDDGNQKFGLRRIYSGDSLREISLKDAEKEKITLFDSIIKLFK